MKIELTERLKKEISINAGEIERLHSAIHEGFKHREESEEARKRWIQAAQEFHRKYDKLAFPGGCEGALDRIVAGQPEAMEAAICFLEIRPFFFRSGYMFKDILRKCRKAPLSDEQRQRFNVIEANVLAWRKRKQAAQKHSCSKL